ncbi:MAG: leucyl/phenylalanyl-tRNA--protein transferase [bacterium]|nr:leucyl/phenylalanyl-tRNA--protein transferase [bacterium]
MPVYMLGENPSFPPAQMADEEGVIAVGGDLSPERLLNAYASGIFPWFSEGEPILWWSPTPRLVLFPPQLHVSRSMQKFIVKNPLQFTVTVDGHFEQVIAQCSQPRVKQAETWITDEMQQAYSRLHQLGFAHSVEVWQTDRLVGGLYGVSLGNCFFGESMFSTVSNASKYAFIGFVRFLDKLKFRMVDCQVHTDHLDSLGAEEIPRKKFLKLLAGGLKNETIRGNWGPIWEAARGKD